MLILGVKGAHSHAHDHDDDAAHGHHHDDHNFRSAYFHVLADALTSILAIAALLVAKYYGQTWLDPLMGIVGAILVSKWAIGLLRDSGGVLLDRQASASVLDKIRAAIEKEPDTKVADLHVWSIGPGKQSAIIAIEAATPLELNDYRAMLPTDLGLVHVTIEVARAGE